MTDSKQVAPIQMNKIAKLAGWASVVNIISWLLIAIPGFLNSSWSFFELVSIPLSALVALVAGIMGLVSKSKIDGRGVGQCVIGVSVGVFNIVLIVLVIIGIHAMVNFS